MLGDLVEDGQRLRVAACGRGGRGNASFCTPINRAPRFAENGEPGEERELALELKIMADAGLVGLPNAGKSSLLNRISAAHPKIGDYPFTTLVPILGVVSLGEHRSCVFADIPGLIEGASDGLGLGHQFLRHIERTRVLVHVLDATGGESGDPLDNYDVVSRELERYNPALSMLPVLAALNKIDLVDADEIRQLCDLLKARGIAAFPISAVTGEGIDRLLYRVGEILTEQAAAVRSAGNARIVITPPSPHRPRREWSVRRDEDGAWRVSGEGLERLVAMTNVDNESALERLDRVLDRHGILDALKSSGVRDGDPVRIRTTEFVFVDQEKAFAGRRRKPRTRISE
jgi:GTP-binding protein